MPLYPFTTTSFLMGPGKGEGALSSLIQVFRATSDALDPTNQFALLTCHGNKLLLLEHVIHTHISQGKPMCGRLDSYLISFAGLRVDKNKKSWSSLTHYHSPYKPVLLLSILDHFASGQITTNLIEPSSELVATFQDYVALLSETERPASMAAAFYDLESSGFWELMVQPGIKHKKGLAIGSIKELRLRYIGAKVPQDLFLLMQMHHTREKLRSSLVTKYFAQEIQTDILDQSTINCTSE